MSFFDLDPTATQNALDRAALNPLNPEDLKPGWFAGAWKAPVTGLASAVTDATLLAGDAAPTALRPVARPIDQLFGTKLEDKVNQIPDYALAASQFTAPDPRTTGVIGQVVHGLFNIVPEVMAGGPETAAVLQGYKSFRFGMADGLDPGTAFGKGAIDGISTWVGLKIPMSVAPRLGVAGTVGTGVAGNVLTGMATRGATGKLLEERGYKDMAEQYKVLDQSAIAVDFLLGGGMGALAHYGPIGLARYKEIQAEKRNKTLLTDLDTALNLNNQLHMELDTAPGIPTSPEARQAHVEAVTDAITALMKGDEVNVRPEVTTTDFVENPTATAVRTEIVRAVEEHMGPEWVALDAELKARGLTSEDVDTSPVIRTTRAAPEIVVSEANGRLEAVSPVGRVYGEMVDGALHIKGSEVVKDMQGQGLGTKHYLALITNALDRGLRVFSDGTVEPEAKRVYDALQRRGFDVVKREGSEVTPSGAAFGKDATEPAFEVRRAKGQPDPILADNPDMSIPAENGQTLPAVDALAQADAEIASAKQDSQAFDAAVACALRG